MRPYLVRWIVAVLAIGMVAAAVHAFSSSDGHRVAATASATPRPPSSARPPSTTVPPTPSPGPAVPATGTSAAPAASPTTVPESTPAAPRPISFTTEAPPTTPAPNPDVAIYGDSLTVLAWAHYQELTAGAANTQERAFAGAELPNWSSQILSDPIHRLVLALGTNDADHDGAKPWADLLDALPSTTCVVWPKPYEGSSAVQLFNAQMMAIVATHPNVHVIDWNAEASAHPEWVSADHKHYVQAGSDHYAEMLQRAAALCP